MTGCELPEAWAGRLGACLIAWEAGTSTDSSPDAGVVRLGVGRAAARPSLPSLPQPASPGLGWGKSPMNVPCTQCTLPGVLAYILGLASGWAGVAFLGSGMGGLALG